MFTQFGKIDDDKMKFHKKKLLNLTEIAIERILLLYDRLYCLM